MDVLINIQGTTEDVLDEPTAALFQQQWQLFSARNTRPCGKETR